ncbi:hypothetical protein EB796_009462 [Bugula neritina]|uniref:Uncharacterized protein n=1 Tax=Bugula neritina TaxID=10212 RepID=A0A7J7K238_BUGNE|nr:hypothetical protein EB796_009462 [Bugula neritina]
MYVFVFHSLCRVQEGRFSQPPSPSAASQSSLSQKSSHQLGYEPSARQHPSHTSPSPYSSLCQRNNSHNSQIFYEDDFSAYPTFDQSYENGESGDPCPTYGYRGYDISNCSRVQSSPHTLTYDPPDLIRASHHLHCMMLEQLRPNFDNHEQLPVPQLKNRDYRLTDLATKPQATSLFIETERCRTPISELIARK